MVRCRRFARFLREPFGPDGASHHRGQSARHLARDDGPGRAGPGVCRALFAQLARQFGALHCHDARPAGRFALAARGAQRHKSGRRRSPAAARHVGRSRAACPCDRTCRGAAPVFARSVARAERQRAHSGRSPEPRGIWARFDRTPFGHGTPYTTRQLARLLRDNLFVPQQTRNCLFAPPLAGSLWLSSAPAVERLGVRFFPALAGVSIVEASKTLYAPMPVRGRVRARAKLAPAAQVARAE